MMSLHTYDDKKDKMYINANSNYTISFVHITILRVSLAASANLKTTALGHTMPLGLDSRQKSQIGLGKILPVRQPQLLPSGI